MNEEIKIERIELPFEAGLFSEKQQFVIKEVAKDFMKWMIDREVDPDKLSFSSRIDYRYDSVGKRINQMTYSIRLKFEYDEEADGEQTTEAK